MRAIFDIAAIRGATTVENNSEADIKQATSELMEEITQKNNLLNEDMKVISIHISTTSDITAIYPAKIIREMGFSKTALFSSIEPEMKKSLPLCIRILVNIASYKNEITPKHIYLRSARVLRSDFN